ncbi:carbohydrate ABC transporter permease [Fimbriimonas ginsengisoli]|uniref:Sugar ABC transporter permease n=1 Tax=Fimbriimonas ginsengisoli Gsoil 348 TaxID=661478 RepID=A0A068NWW1_FIMGI|nr:carbohydrate ABC transporter permease [Fimbriimonas ginsengisoli]AIE87931.1 sugar ABC transporter permease [Fimbriimonas ginsengisoli Gsoil 348]
MKVRVLPGLLVILVGLLLCLAPLAWMLSTSLKPFDELFKGAPSLIPAHPRGANYSDALRTFDFLRAFGNSAFVAVLTVLGTLASSIPAAYAFARLKARGSDWVFYGLLATLMLPGQITIIPVFRLFASLGMVDTYAPLIVPAWLGTNAFAVFLLRQFFRTLPEETMEAARLDGASEGKILVSIAVPLARPAVVTVAVFAFLGSWNDLWGPLVYLHREERMTLPVALVNFVGSSGTVQGTPWNLVMAAAVVTVLPAVALFALCQRSFVSGIATTGLK